MKNTRGTMNRISTIISMTATTVSLLASIMLTACQPTVVQVDVTRIVEVTSANAGSGVGGVVVTVEAPVTVEVTRIVNQEVTRVITSTVVKQTMVEVTKSPVGNAERPIHILFSPVTDTPVILMRGQLLAEALSRATGMAFEIGILDDEANIVQLLCSAPAESIGFLSAAGFVLARNTCGAQAGTIAVRSDGLTWQAGMVVARRDSGIQSLEDLQGKTWAVPDAQSVPETLAFQAEFAEKGIEIAQVSDLPGDNSALLAVYNREADFATAAYIPPILPFEERQWEYGIDSPEIWRRVGISPRRSPIGYVLVNGEPEFGGYRLRDARSGIFDIVPGIYDETVIIALSPAVPNDGAVFGAEFPLGTARQIISALLEFAASNDCATSLCSPDFYGWIGMAPAEDASYDPLVPLIGSVLPSSQE